MKKIENIPNASTLITSMRSIGYDFESAVSDIIDNSISAGAKNIELFFSISNPQTPYLGFFDDGEGMSRLEIIEAMRFGSVKTEKRNSNDLGRFGLGLKTASISQCKKFSVISKKNDQIYGFSWDIDLLTSDSGWNMIEIDNEQIITNPLIQKYVSNSSSFTLVLWEKFDTIHKDVTTYTNINDVFLRRIELTEKHVSLVFHRYLDEGLVISFNGNQVLPVDPFLSYHAKTTIKEEQVVNTRTSDGSNEKVKMQVYVLPYQKDLTSLDIEKLGHSDGPENQGFYIYRNKRLMIHGTWFRIKPKAELSRNARIRVDIPNTLDDMWSIDIKKQKAVIPASLLEQLKGEVSDAISKSRQIHDYKGTLQVKDGSIWVKRVDREDKINYLINRESDVVKKALSILSDGEFAAVDRLLEMIQFSIPYRDIYNAVAEKKDINTVDEENKDKILFEAIEWYKDIRKKTSMTKEAAIQMICSIEPFLSSNIKKDLEEQING